MFESVSVSVFESVSVSVFESVSVSVFESPARLLLLMLSRAGLPSMKCFVAN